MYSSRLLAFGLAVTFFSCDDKNSDPRPDQALPSVEFSQTEIIFDEDELEGSMRLVLNKPATEIGVVTLRFTALDLTMFSIQPQPVNGKIDLVVSQGCTEIFFRVRPVNNGVIDGNKNLFITVDAVSSGLRVGSNRNLSLSVLDDESPVNVNFMMNMGSIRENATQSQPIVILLANAAPADGSIEINFIASQLTYGVHFITEPAVQNGKIVIPVGIGEARAFFKVIPINNQLVNGDHQIQFIMSKATGGVTLGPGHLHVFTITDDETMSLAKGYQTTSDSWNYQRQYTYNENGSVDEVKWQSHTPYFRSGSFTYEYDAQGRVQKETHSGGLQKIYTWLDNRIVKMEEMNSNVVNKYTLYGYTLGENVAEAVVYDRQPSGQFVVSYSKAYLYHPDGNLHKEFVLSANNKVLSSSTFESYLPELNPFPVVEILPTMNAQRNLPASVKFKNDSRSESYQFSYEFRADGLPLQRRATNNSTVETSVYQYY